MEQEIESKGIIRLEKSGRIGCVIVSNPERRNAMTLSMWQDLPRQFARFENDVDIRVVLLTGEGARAFVSGADISEFKQQRHSQAGVSAYETQVARALEYIRSFPKPVIARINGPCIGGGLALALACDIRIAVDTAQFGIPAAKLGLGYEYPGIQKLVGIVGEAKASEMMFTAQLYGATDAHSMGLLNVVATPDALDQAVNEMANEIAVLAPLSIRAAKRAIRAVASFGETELKQEAEQAVAQCAVSRDYKEGIAAFLEKRDACFVGQ